MILLPYAFAYLTSIPRPSSLLSSPPDPPLTQRPYRSEIRAAYGANLRQRKRRELWKFPCCWRKASSFPSPLSSSPLLPLVLLLPPSALPQQHRGYARRPLGTACTDSLFSLNFCSFRDAMRSIYGVTATMRPLRRVTVTNRYTVFFSFFLDGTYIYFV